MEFFGASWPVWLFFSVAALAYGSFDHFLRSRRGARDTEPSLKKDQRSFLDKDGPLILVTVTLSLSLILLAFSVIIKIIYSFI